MRRIAMTTMLGFAIGAAAVPASASASASPVVVEHASAHLRGDGRVELFVHVRHPRTADLKGHVHVGVVDDAGRTIAAGGDDRSLRSGRDLRYHVLLARSRSARVAARMRHDGHLRLRVRYRGTMRVAGTTTKTVADVAALEASVLDTDISVTIASGLGGGPGVIVLGDTPYAGCFDAPTLPTPSLNDPNPSPATVPDTITCFSASATPVTLTLTFQTQAGQDGSQSATVTTGSFDGTTVTGGELTGSVYVSQWPPDGYILDADFSGSVTTMGDTER